MQKPLYLFAYFFGFSSSFDQVSVRKSEEAESENKNSLKLIAR